MDPRLEEACLNGSLAALHELLQEDRLLLHRLTAAPHSVDNPLHIAASLGHTELAKEILDRKPELAHELNGQGLSPLHLAAANGHLAMVRLLLKNAGSDLCFAVDRNGLIAAHIAAIKGRIDVLKELLDVHPEMIRALTCRGETLLHLAVKSNCFETAKFLAERIGGDDVDHGELLNAKDEKGYTVLHLAVARKQLQVTHSEISEAIFCTIQKIGQSFPHNSANACQHW